MPELAGSTVVPRAGGLVPSSPRMRVHLPYSARPSVARPRREWGRRDESGQAAEAVIVFPVLLLLIMSVVQFGLWYHAANVAKAAVAEGVRTARAEGATGGDGAAATNAFLAQAGPTIVENVQLNASRDANVARVELRATAARVIPGLPLQIHALAESPVERFRADDGSP